MDEINNKFPSPSGVFVFSFKSIGRLTSDAELRQLQSKMRHLHDIKSEIDEKDKKVTAVVRQSYEDVKAELESLKVDKKKIDYYSSVKLGGKGRTFNTNS